MATNPRNAIISQIQSMAPELLKGVDVNALEDVYLNRMLDDAKRLSYGQRELAYNMANPERQYLFENPADYYQAYGAIPVNFQGTSGYYDTKEKAQDIRYLTPDANASYRLVSPKSGQVLGTGTGQQGLLDLATQANRLNTELGREADWQLVQTGPSGDQVIGTNKYNSDRTLLGKIFGPIMDVGLPILSSALIPGAGLLGTVLPAAAGSAVASAANDRSLKDTLLRAAIAGAGAGIGEKLFAPAQAAGKGAETAATNLSSDLVPNALEGLSFGSIAQVDPTAALGGALGGGVGSAGGALGDIIVTGARNAAFNVPGSLTGSLLANAATTTLPEVGPLDTPTQPQSEKPKGFLDKLTSNLGVTDYLTLAGLAGSGINSLLGGGKGTGAGTPYVSPFGAGGAFGNVAGRDMRAPQTNTDYERYGFGPEATFFQPAYNTLVSGAAATNPATTPTYRPLI